MDCVYPSDSLRSVSASLRLNPKNSIEILTGETTEAVPEMGRSASLGYTPLSGYLRPQSSKMYFSRPGLIHARIPIFYTYIKDDFVTLRVYV